MSEASAGALYMPLSEVDVSFSHNALEKRARRLCEKYGIALSTNPRPGKHLSENDPRVKAIKQWVQTAKESGKFHPRCLGHWDQMWTTLIEPARKVLTASTKSLDPIGGPGLHQRRKMRDSICAELGVTNEFVEQKKQVCELAKLRGAGTICAPEGWRLHGFIHLYPYDAFFILGA